MSWRNNMAAVGIIAVRRHLAQVVAAADSAGPSPASTTTTRAV